jgi:hypothetical protein
VGNFHINQAFNAEFIGMMIKKSLMTWPTKATTAPEVETHRLERLRRLCLGTQNRSLQNLRVTVQNIASTAALVRI